MAREAVRPARQSRRRGLTDGSDSVRGHPPPDLDPGVGLSARSGVDAVEIRTEDSPPGESALLGGQLSQVGQRQEPRQTGQKERSERRVERRNGPARAYIDHDEASYNQPW